MKRFSEQFNKKSLSVKLETTEKQELRQRVVSYMEYHPLPSSMKNASAKAILSPFLRNEEYKTVRIPLTTFLKWSAVLSAFILVVVPVLAERAAPGDSLYAVKVRFNEEVRATLTLSPYEKVEWETERLNRRITEARLLASEGRLTDEVGAEMAAAVREHTENVQHEIEVLRQSDADQATLASIELNTTLEVQSTSLQGEGTTMAMAMMATDSATDSSTQLLADVINETLSKQGPSASSSVPAYEKIMARVEINTTRAYELLNSLNLAQEDTLRSDIDRRLQDVNRSIEKANSARGNDEGGAQRQLVSVLERTQKLIVFMTDIEVNKSLALESIVPTILTPEEEQQFVEQQAEDIAQKVKILAESTDQMDAALLGKVTYALDVVATKQAEIIVASDGATKKALTEEVLALLNDTLILAGLDGTVVPTEPITEVIEEVATSTGATIEQPVTE
jgi:hypothetical protein